MTPAEQDDWGRLAFQILDEAGSAPASVTRPSDNAVEVPDSQATVGEIFTFALTFNAFDRLGGFEPTAAIGNHVLNTWLETRALPNSIAALRIALFFEQRRWRHYGFAPDERATVYLHALTNQLRDLTGGSVAGPPDDEPSATGP
jgi:hypothetical protein